VVKDFDSAADFETAIMREKVAVEVTQAQSGGIALNIMAGDIELVGCEGIWGYSEEHNAVIAERIAACMNFCANYTTAYLLDMMEG